MGLSQRNELDYNWTLEILRKKGKLGGVFRRRKKRTSSLRDSDYRLAKDAARTIMDAGLPKDIDRIMCDPVLRQQFDDKSKNVAPGLNPYLVRKAALNYRKKGSRKVEFLTK